jgi:hypothetical protein
LANDAANIEGWKKMGIVSPPLYFLHIAHQYALREPHRGLLDHLANAFCRYIPRYLIVRTNNAS